MGGAAWLAAMGGRWGALRYGGFSRDGSFVFDYSPGASVLGMRRKGGEERALRSDFGQQKSDGL